MSRLAVLEHGDCRTWNDRLPSSPSAAARCLAGFCMNWWPQDPTVVGETWHTRQAFSIQRYWAMSRLAVLEHKHSKTWNDRLPSSPSAAARYLARLLCRPVAPERVVRVDQRKNQASVQDPGLRAMGKTNPRDSRTKARDYHLRQRPHDVLLDFCTD